MHDQPSGSVRGCSRSPSSFSAHNYCHPPAPHLGYCRCFARTLTGPWSLELPQPLQLPSSSQVSLSAVTDFLAHAKCHGCSRDSEIMHIPSQHLPLFSGLASVQMEPPSQALGCLGADTWGLCLTCSCHLPHNASLLGYLSLSCCPLMQQVLWPFPSPQPFLLWLRGLQARQLCPHSHIHRPGQRPLPSPCQSPGTAHQCLVTA